MKRHALWTTGLLTILALTGCGGGDVEEPADSLAQVELVEAATAPDLFEARTDSPGSADVADALKPPDTVPEYTSPEEISADDFQDYVGGPGYPCASGADCIEGFCIQTVDGMQCTVTCIEECPFDWQCVLHSPSLPDEVYICAAPLVSLCRPCQTNDDCRVGGLDTGAACVDYGQAGFFCGAQCETGDDCPATHGCAQVVDVAGATRDQCVLTAGECPCSKWAVNAGADTTCFYENENGTCEGHRQCLAAGLEPCSALVPAAESCNGLDDNCDGQIDEALGGGPCLVVNEFGTCPGVDNCVAATTVCEGPEAKTETCDGADNDCDGQTDEGFEDTDGDGVADCLVNDKDGDGVVDGLDNCPTHFNPSQPDSDLDTIGDVCDPDDDNDQVADEDDCAPKDDEIYPGNDELCDGKDNNCNYLVDEGNPDTDGDGWKDCFDEDDDGDGTDDGLDCAPLDPAIHPNAAETCDGVDNDCDGATDSGFPDLDNDGLADCVDDDTDGDGVGNADDNCPALANAPQDDLDGDGAGDECDSDLDGDSVPNAMDNCVWTPNPFQVDSDQDGNGDACDEDPDGDGFSAEDDNCPDHHNPGQDDLDQDGLGDACDDDDDGDGDPDESDCAALDLKVHHGAEEICDGLDNNCHLGIDEGFIDSDLDGYKNCIDDDDDNDGTTDDKDCAPTDPWIHHGAAEQCNGLDDDCNNQVDDGLGKSTCGFGECEHTIDNCQAGILTMCNPFADVQPEVCDGKDNDCDAQVDEDLGTTWCGLGECHHSVANCLDGQTQECDPLDGAADEVCDGKDNDCNGIIDDGLPTLACGKGQCFNTISSCVGGTTKECNPFLGAAPESCDGKDNDCDGEKDEELGDISCGQGECFHTQPYCVEGKPTNCDPFLGVQPEICDSLDNDCDGLADEELGTTTCGLGVCEHTVANCLGGEPVLCDPEEGATPEHCDGLDNDCDGTSDPEDALGCEPYYNDTDLDEWGVEGASKCLCKAEAPYLATKFGDCEDTKPAINPGADEDCALPGDENCDGNVNEDCVYVSCSAVLDVAPNSNSGIYLIDPDGDGVGQPYQVYCDMDTEGGGWTLISRVSSASTTWSWAAYNKDNSVWGDSETWAKTEMRNQAFFDLPGDELLLRTISDNNDYVHVTSCSDGQVSLGWRFKNYSWTSGCTAKRCQIIKSQVTAYFPWSYDTHQYSCAGSCGNPTSSIGFMETSSPGNPGQDDSVLLGWNGGDSGYHQGLGNFEDGKVPADAQCYCNSDQDGSSCSGRYFGLFIR